MKLRLPGTVKSLNVEHPTPNIERRILMTLRFIYLKKMRTAACDEPFGCELRVERLSRFEFRRVDSLCSVFFQIDRIHYSMLDVQCSMFISFFFD